MAEINMIKEKYTTNIWDKTNVAFLISTIISSIAFFVFFILSFMLKDNAQSLIIGFCGVFASFSSAFFIAVFIRVLDMRKKQQAEAKAFEIIKTNIRDIFAEMGKFIPQIKCFVKINQDDTVDYPKEILYYTDIDGNIENRNYIDFNNIFKSAKFNIDHTLDKCLSLPIFFQCNENIIRLISKIKSNQFTFDLCEIYKARNYLTNTSFMNIFNEYNEIIAIYNELSILADMKKSDNLRKLTDEEEIVYKKEIESIRLQLPQLTTGTVYKGYKRIQ